MITFTTIIYLAIAVMVFASVLYNMIFKETKVVDKISCAMILVCLILRIFMIK